MTLADFWASTPREVFEVIAGAVERDNRAYRLATIQAYYAGAIARSDGRLPSYKEMFPEDAKEKPEATPEQHVTFWENTAALVNAMEAARQAAAKGGQDRQTV